MFSWRAKGVAKQLLRAKLEQVLRRVHSRANYVSWKEITKRSLLAKVAQALRQCVYLHNQGRQPLIM